MPAWLMHLRECDRASERQADTEQSSSRAVMQAHLADEVEVLRWGSVSTHWRTDTHGSI
jgi:hypothetical protein